MAGTVSLTGLSSDINWTNLITDMINAQKSSVINPLQNKKSTYQSKLSAWQSFNTLLLSLKNYIDNNNLDEVAGYNLYTYNLTTSNPSITPANVLGVSLGNVEGQGSYSIEITAIAQAEKLASDSQSSKTEELGLNGTIQINDTEITIDPEDTLSLIASKINEAGAGVTASILKISDSDYRLILESQSTGASGMTLIDANDVLETLGILNTSDEKKNVITGGADASFTIDGYSITSSSNTITDVIEGVILTLKSTNEGSPIRLSIVSDSSSQTGRVSAMVSSINSILNYIKTQNTYNEGSAPPLMGDMNLQMVRSTLTTAVFADVAENTTYKNASSIGITFGSDGSLSVNTTTLNSALSSNREEVLNILTNLGNALKTSMNLYIDPYTGSLTYMEKSINESVSAIDKRIDELNERFERQKEELEKRFNSLELLISTSNLLKNWLTQQADYMRNKNE